MGDRKTILLLAAIDMEQVIDRRGSTCRRPRPDGTARSSRVGGPLASGGTTALENLRTVCRHRPRTGRRASVDGSPAVAAVLWGRGGCCHGGDAHLSVLRLRGGNDDAAGSVRRAAPVHGLWDDVAAASRGLLRLLQLLGSALPAEAALARSQTPPLLVRVDPRVEATWEVPAEKSAEAGALADALGRAAAPPAPRVVDARRERSHAPSEGTRNSRSRNSLADPAFCRVFARLAAVSVPSPNARRARCDGRAF